MSTQIKANATVPDAWCVTKKISACKSEYHWTIENFVEECETGEEFKMMSNGFTVSANGERAKMWMGIFFSPYTGSYNVYPNLIRADDRGKNSWKIDHKFAILDKNNQKRNESTGQHFSILKDILVSNATDWLPNGCLTILCELTIHGSTKNVSGDKLHGQTDNIDTDTQALKSHMRSLFSQREFTDVKVLCGSQVFDCHKAILASRSPVFRAMLTTDMVEARTNKVEIKDRQPGVVYAMLEYIYCGQTEDLKSFAGELLHAADYYQISSLKDSSELELINTLGIDNCVGRLVLGEDCQAARLKQIALQFLVHNLGRVVTSNPNWNSHMSHALQAQVFEFIATGKSGPGDEPPRKRFKR